MEIPKRKRTRLKEYDYSQNGYYFITICTKDKQKTLCHIVGEGFPLPQLTPLGKIAEKYIYEIGKKYSTAMVDKFVIMPNHIHIILCLENNGRGNPSPTISNIMGWCKYNITKHANQNENTLGRSVFQRSFHDHIIRGEEDYLKIWEYIETNPAKWKEDCFFSE